MLLGSMATLEDGMPADPGEWSIWLDAAEAARTGDNRLIQMRLSRD
ncbi:hypothetical protein [Ancylobacter terrae]